MAANRCRAYKVMDDPWYSVSCSLPLGHGGRHEHHWHETDDGHRMRRPAKQGGGA